MYYSLLRQYELEDDENKTRLASAEQARRHGKAAIIFLTMTLLTSLSLNFYFLLLHSRASELVYHLPSKYAGLYRDMPTEIVKYADYNSPNRTIENAAWDNTDLLPEQGFIALDDSWAASKGLPTSQRWPWDNSKGVYILTSSHELHCVRVLRESVNQAHDVVPQSWPHLHVLHCLNVLRESVMCNADDTPMYTGRLHNETHAMHPKAGIGSMKMCRDWNKLQAFAQIERYKYCPDGARPWEGKPAKGAYEED